MDNKPSVPTIAEAVGKAVDEIKVPSVDSIGELPKVEMPSVDSVSTPPMPDTGAVQAQTQPVTQPVQTAVSTSVQTNTLPTVTQPSAAAPTYAAPTYAQPSVYQVPVTVNTKKSVGQIIALIFGVLLTSFFSLCLIILICFFLDTKASGDIDNTITIIMFGLVLLPLLLGILLIRIGAKKKKAVIPTAIPAGASYLPTAVTYAPTATAATAAPVQTAPAAAPVSGTGTSAAPVSGTGTAAAPVSGTGTAAAPSDPSAAAPTTLPTVTTANTTGYQYAATEMVGGDAEKVARKKALKSGLLAILCVVIMWVLVFALDILSWYLLIIPFVLSFNAIRTCVKSPAGWFGMVLSVLSTVLLVLLMILGASA